MISALSIVALLGVAGSAGAHVAVRGYGTVPHGPPLRLPCRRAVGVALGVAWPAAVAVGSAPFASVPLAALVLAGLFGVSLVPAALSDLRVRLLYDGALWLPVVPLALLHGVLLLSLPDYNLWRLAMGLLVPVLLSAPIFLLLRLFRSPGLHLADVVAFTLPFVAGGFLIGVAAYALLVPLAIAFRVAYNHTQGLPGVTLAAFAGSLAAISVAMVAVLPAVPYFGALAPAWECWMLPAWHPCR